MKQPIMSQTLHDSPEKDGFSITQKSAKTFKESEPEEKREASRKRFSDQRKLIDAQDEADQAMETQKLQESLNKKMRILSLSKSKERPKTSDQRGRDKLTKS